MSDDLQRTPEPSDGDPAWLPLIPDPSAGEPVTPVPSEDPRPAGEGEARAQVVLGARGIVAYELARWPHGDAKELDLAVERLAHQGQRLAVPVESLIVELKLLVQRHVGAGRPEHEYRGMRERLVSVLIEAFYRAQR